jgi:hypothetical protein
LPDVSWETKSLPPHLALEGYDKKGFKNLMSFLKFSYLKRPTEDEQEAKSTSKI